MPRAILPDVTMPILPRAAAATRLFYARALMANANFSIYIDGEGF